MGNAPRSTSRAKICASLWEDEQCAMLKLPMVLAALQGADPWQQVAFVLTPQTEFGDQRPLDQLRAGAVSAVVRVAQGTGAAVREATPAPSTS